MGYVVSNTTCSVLAVNTNCAYLVVQLSSHLSAEFNELNTVMGFLENWVSVC